MTDKETKAKKLGRPKKPEVEEAVDEKQQERLDMEDKNITIDDVTKR